MSNTITSQEQAVNVVHEAHGEHHPGLIQSLHRQPTLRFARGFSFITSVIGLTVLLVDSLGSSATGPGSNSVPFAAVIAP